MDLRRSRHSVHSINCHLVFVPKYRRDIFADGDVAEGCRQILNRIAEKLGYKLLALQVMPDHVHLFVAIPPTICVSTVVNRLKGASSRELQVGFPQIRSKLWGNHIWSNGYFCRTAGDVTASTIERYINDTRHHKL